MFEVLAIQNKEEQRTLAKTCGQPFHEELLAYKVLVEGRFCGLCQFTMDERGGRIVEFSWIKEEYSFHPIFTLGRAALNFIDLCGVHKAFFDAPCSDETLIKAIGFSKSAEGRYEIDLTDFFKEPCKHNK